MQLHKSHVQHACAFLWVCMCSHRPACCFVQGPCVRRVVLVCVPLQRHHGQQLFLRQQHLPWRCQGLSLEGQVGGERLWARGTQGDSSAGTLLACWLCGARCYQPHLMGYNDAMTGPVSDDFCLACTKHHCDAVHTCTWDARSRATGGCEACVVHVEHTALACIACRFSWPVQMAYIQEDAAVVAAAPKSSFALTVPVLPCCRRPAASTTGGWCSTCSSGSSNKPCFPCPCEQRPALTVAV